MVRIFSLILLTALAALRGTPLLAQSQAANGAIEGVIRDTSGGVLPGATVTVMHLDSGTERSTLTGMDGRYRAPLLPLGLYRVVAELPGFKRFEQVNVRLGAGQTLVINVTLDVGAVSETVTVSAENRPVLNAAKIDAGRNLTAVEVKNLPLVARNPYNFALVQPGVTGYENAEFGVPRLAANGTLMRINYQIDGNTNTEKDRAGLRLLPVSEVMVGEVKVVTAGYAPEFGQTMGLVYNVITPSGTNQVHGDASYLFRRKAFSAFPFYFQGERTEARKPNTKVDTVTGTVGGPILVNKAHYYAGYERTGRDLSATRVITIPVASAAALGLATQPAVIPATQAAKFFLGKADYQLNASNRLTGRYIMFRNDSPYNGSGGALNSLERATDFLDAMNSTAAQLVSTIGDSQLNELRVQYADRGQSSLRNADSGDGPAVDVLGIRFGSPLFAAGQDNDGFRFKQGIFQIVDNVTWLRGAHGYKFGFDGQWVHDERTSAPVNFYTFPSIVAYQAAAAGVAPYGYTQFTQLIGDLSFDMNTAATSLFVQDDWQVSPSIKLVYGLRYDRYGVPEGKSDAPRTETREFRVDGNNWGPRVGAAWAVNDRTVVRASSGLMYDQPILSPYENALQLSGAPQVVSVNLTPTSAGAPAFPGNLSNTPPGFVLPTQSIVIVDRDFEIGRVWQNNLQVERSIANDYTVTMSYVFAKQSQLPVVTNTNLISTRAALADGRLAFESAVNAATRVDPRFNNIYAVQSIGDGHYNALSVTLARRFARGMTFNFGYTIGKGEDNAPINNAIPGGVGLSVNGDDPRSDTVDLDRDIGPNLLDIRHNFNGSLVWAPSTAGAGKRILEALLNQNQIAVLMQFNSGLPFNIRSNRDLNGDGLAADRPLFVGRNPMYLQARYNVDLRYSRFIPIRGSVRGEVIGEFKNVFNTVQTLAVNQTVQVDLAGNPLTFIPADASGFIPLSGFEQRQFQLGFRVRF